MKKKFLALCLCVCLVVTLSPAPVLATETVNPDRAVNANALMDLDSQTPSGYVAGSELHPFGIKKDQPFTMMAESELYLYESYDINKGDYDTHWLNWYDTFTDMAANPIEVNLATRNGTGIAQRHPFAFTEAVAFDPSGSGRNDHIAFTGVRYNNNNVHDVVVWVLDTKDNEISNVLSLGDAPWINNSLEQYKAPNFLSITAGDYDGDGKDSLVAYVCGNTVSVKEVTCTASSTGAPRLSMGGTVTAPLHALYMESVNEWAKNNNENGKYLREEWRLGASLTSGDFNGDGYDDLATLSYTNKIDNGDYMAQLYTPYLTVYMGGAGATSLTGMSRLYADYLRDDPGTETAHSIVTMSTPSIAAGDIDGDSQQELVIAGYYATLKNWDKLCGRDILDNHSLYAAYMSFNNKKEANGAITTETATTFFSVPITEGIRSKADEEDTVLAPIAVECVAVDGVGTAEKVFIGHSLYTVSGGRVTSHACLDDVVLKTLPMGGTGLTYTSEGFRNVVSSIAAGNFIGDKDGREQLFLTFGYRLGNNPVTNDYDDYNYVVFAIGKNGSEYYARASMRLQNRGDDIDERLNCVVVAADRDDDGVMAQFSKSDFFYSDPDPVAVLQAAPWFSELGSWYDFQGGTSYGYSQSYTLGKSSSTSSSFSAGVIGELDAKIAEVSVEMGYTMDWNQTYEISHTTAKEYTFTAGPYDLVVIARTPIFNYYYDVYDPVSKTWKEDKIGFSVPQKPIIYRLTIDAYNSYVDAYNEQAAAYEAAYEVAHPATETTPPAIARLKKIDDKRLHHEGDPFNYLNVNDGNVGVEELSDFITLSQSGSSASFALTTEGEKTINQETSHGFHFQMSVVGGAIIKGGAYMGMDYSKGTGSFKSEGDSTETGCTVIDLDGSMQDATAYYGFDWQFCTWNVDMGVDAAVPVYGYMLKDVSAPTPAVTDLAVDNYDADTGKYTLTWSDPSLLRENAGRTGNVGFNVYVKKDNGELVKQNGEDPVDATSYTFEYKGSYSDVFVVTAVGTDNVESALSNEVIYFKGANGKSAYQLAIDSKHFEGTLEEWLESLKGSSAYEVAVDTYSYTGTIEQWLASLKGDTGEPGKSAYDLAVEEHDYTGTLDDWLNSLIGPAGPTGETGKTAYQIALDNNFVGTEEEWLHSLVGQRGSSGSSGKDGKDGVDGQDGVGISDVKINDGGYLIVTLTDGSTINAGSVRRAQLDPEDILDLYPESPFKDVLKTYWYADAVDFCYGYGLIGGTDSTTFSPNLTVSRGMMVTVLYRLEGSPAVYGNSFKDVAAGQYYAAPVAWAVQSGIVSGYENDRFGPNDPVTYEQAMTILYRYAQYRKYDPGVQGDLTEFSDTGNVGGYALEALNWGEGNGMIVGKTGSILAPKAALKRCELAALFYQFCLYAVN